MNQNESIKMQIIDKNKNKPVKRQVSQTSSLITSCFNLKQRQISTNEEKEV
jgi:hypothetical protein